MGIGGRPDQRVVVKKSRSAADGVPTDEALVTAQRTWFLRCDAVRWLRERRADLYVDLLTEAHAEKQYFDVEIADEETRKEILRHFVDLRLPPLEGSR